MKRLFAIAVLIAVSAGCSPQQVKLWRAWHREDPEAAIAWAESDEGQALIVDDWDRDGVVEPEPVDEPDPDPVEEVEEPSGGGSQWDTLAECESGGNWSLSTGNGYYGGLQFALSTWQAVGGSGYPHENSREEQIHRAEILFSSQGWSPWPGCASALGWF